MDLRSIARTLLGVSAYQPPANTNYPDLESRSVQESRRAQGGQLQQIPFTTLRWYLDDLEAAQYQADDGNLALAARLYRAMRRDGVLAGLLGTRTGGLVRLPKRFYGDDAMCSELRTRNGTRSVFDDMCPPSELALLASDGIVLGVGVGELVPVPGRDFPILIRLDPEFLQYRWVENRWYYASIAGLIPITPGDGRWVLHCPGGRIAPWQSALWPALGKSFINKDHALMNRSNFGAKLANPARVAVSPLGANEIERKGFFQQVMAWASDTVFGMPVGWDVKLIESNGRGYEVFQRMIDTSDKEYTISLAGQTVTSDGGTGFANADIHRLIRADLIQDTGDGLAYTVNTQVLPAYTVQRMGLSADVLRSGPCIEWDTATPKDLTAQASSMTGAANAIAALDKALGEERDPTTGAVTRPAHTNRDGQAIGVDASEILIRFGVPVEALAPTGQVDEIAAARARATQPATSEAA